MRSKKFVLLSIFALAVSIIQIVQPANAEVKCKPSTAVATKPKSIAASRTFSAFPALLTLSTNCGEIDIQLQPENAPITTTAILTLARGGYYDKTLCHRMTTEGIFIIQCGDPTATGSGGPGWTYVDENLPKSALYPAGTVAMANSGPNTNGSQFFIAYKDSQIPANYSVWGNVISGLEILEYIASRGVVGNGIDGAPAYSLSIESIQEGDANSLAMFNKGLARGAKDSAAIKSSLEALTKANESLTLQTSALQTDKVNLQAELNKAKSALATSTQSAAKLSAKLSQICKARPKPKGC